MSPSDWLLVIGVGVLVIVCTWAAAVRWVIWRSEREMTEDLDERSS